MRYLQISPANHDPLEKNNFSTTEKINELRRNRAAAITPEPLIPTRTPGVFTFECRRAFEKLSRAFLLPDFHPN